MSDHPDDCNCHVCVNVHGIRVDPAKLGYSHAGIGTGFADAFKTTPAVYETGPRCTCGSAVEAERLRAEVERLRRDVNIAMDASNAEVTRWRGSYENEFQTSRRCMDELTAMGKRNKELTEAIEGARDSFKSIQARCQEQWDRFSLRLPPEGRTPCGCEPGSMCTLCEAKEAAEAMAFTLEHPGFEIGEDSPADIELARKAFGDGGT